MIMYSKSAVAAQKIRLREQNRANAAVKQAVKTSQIKDAVSITRLNQALDIAKQADQLVQNKKEELERATRAVEETQRENSNLVTQYESLQRNGKLLKEKHAQEMQDKNSEIEKIQDQAIKDSQKSSQLIQNMQEEIKSLKKDKKDIQDSVGAKKQDELKIERLEQENKDIKDSAGAKDQEIEQLRSNNEEFKEEIRRLRRVQRDFEDFKKEFEESNPDITRILPTPVGKKAASDEERELLFGDDTPASSVARTPDTSASRLSLTPSPPARAASGIDDDSDLTQSFEEPKRGQNLDEEEENDTSASLDLSSIDDSGPIVGLGEVKENASIDNSHFGLIQSSRGGLDLAEGGQGDLSVDLNVKTPGNSGLVIVSNDEAAKGVSFSLNDETNKQIFKYDQGVFSLTPPNPLKVNARKSNYTPAFGNLWERGEDGKQVLRLTFKIRHGTINFYHNGIDIWGTNPWADPINPQKLTITKLSEAEFEHQWVAKSDLDYATVYAGLLSEQQGLSKTGEDPREEYFNEQQKDAMKQIASIMLEVHKVVNYGDSNILQNRDAAFDEKKKPELKEYNELLELVKIAQQNLPEMLIVLEGLNEFVNLGDLKPASYLCAVALPLEVENKLSEFDACCTAYVDAVPTRITAKTDKHLRSIVKSLCSYENMFCHSLLHSCMPYWRQLGRNYDDFLDALVSMAGESPYFYTTSPVLMYYQIVSGVRLAHQEGSTQTVKFNSDEKPYCFKFEDNTIFWSTGGRREIEQAHMLLSTLGQPNCSVARLFCQKALNDLVRQETAKIYGSRIQCRIMKRLPETYFLDPARIAKAYRASIDSEAQIMQQASEDELVSFSSVVELRAEIETMLRFSKDKALLVLRTKTNNVRPVVPMQLKEKILDDLTEMLQNVYEAQSSDAKQFMFKALFADRNNSEFASNTEKTINGFIARLKQEKFLDSKPLTYWTETESSTRIDGLAGDWQLRT